MHATGRFCTIYSARRLLNQQGATCRQTCFYSSQPLNFPASTTITRSPTSTGDKASDVRSPTIRWRYWCILLGSGLLASGIAWWIVGPSNPTTESLIAQSRLCLAKGQYSEAELLSWRVLSENPTHPVAVLLAARAAIVDKRDEKALDYLRPAINQISPDSQPCFRLAAETYVRLGYVTEAERCLNALLGFDPDDSDTANQLAYLLGVEGRGFESAAPLFAALKTGKFTPHHLVMLAAGEPVINDTAFVDRCRKRIPHEPLLLLGQARQALVDQKFDLAAPLLRQLVGSMPDSQEAQSRLGLFLLQQGTEKEFLEWQSKLPTPIWHPEIWVDLGQWARQRKEPRIAARCFWEALKRDPNHRLACYQLGQLLVELNQDDSSKACLKRASLLEKLAFLVDRIYENPEASHLMVDAAKLTEQLGRTWEAWGWARCAVVSNPEQKFAANMVQRLQEQLHPDTPRTMTDAAIAAIDLSSTAFPEWISISRAQPSNVPTASISAIRFENVADSAGLHFQYDNGHDPNSETTRMLESIGGGVAILDFDQDGTPDIYFAQAGTWDAPDSANQPPDKLFRNVEGRSFLDVANSARLGDRSFSQGCTVGDFDSDGFPDLYVANVGDNRFYRNEGDGTFTDVTKSAGINGKHWTTSCLLADVNGDGLPDLYDVNYLDISEAPRTLCVKGEEARTCGPGVFHAESDQLHLNLGDGRFEDITSSSGIDVPNGKGLGIVAADFTRSGRLNLFVANDSVPNFYFVSQDVPRGTAPKFSDEALVSGLALSYDGLPAAWMGVAAGDANGDGLLDLFATSYADQAKSLFQQEPTGGQFRDVIVESGMKAPGWKLLGFGTQFLDADRDGRLDIVVTNGHVFDLSRQNQMYEMPPQIFRNLGGGKFTEISSDELGPFFKGKYLGRGLARVDWNQDGLDDFVVSHMRAPAGLLTNRSVTPGHFFCLRLVGTQTNRDAIGTRVTIRCGKNTWTQQLTAGDGFEASNERKLLFGLGGAERVDEVAVEWLSGERHVMQEFESNSEWLLVQGQGCSKAYRLKRK